MLACETYHYRQSTRRVMRTLAQMHLSGLANNFQQKCCVHPVKCLRLATQRCNICRTQFCCVSPRGAPERFNAEQLEQPHSKQLRARLDISSCTGLCWVSTESWFTWAPPTLSCCRLSNAKLLSASKLGSVRRLQGVCPLPESPCPPRTCESLHRGARRRKQSAKRVCINNVAEWACRRTVGS